MKTYILRRVVQALLILFLLSIASFTIIQLPPGDYLTTYIAQLRQSGADITEDRIAALEQRYGLGKPMIVQYGMWMQGMLLEGDMGMSFHWNRPVSLLLRQRVPLTLAVSLATIIFTYLVAIPIGIYSATHQYSVGDHVFTGVGFIGIATPNFLLALALMYLSVRYLGGSVGGLFSREYADAAWSLAKVWDLMKHLPIPVIVVGTAGTASIIRVMRGSLLDELQKQYVETGRAKGVSERRLLYKYPVRISINPLVSSMAWLFPAIISGGVITAIVLNLPTVGPLLLEALRNQDMFLAGGIVMILGALTVIGTLISDMLLVWLDPRIRFD